MTKHALNFLLCLAGLIFTSCYPYVVQPTNTGTIQPQASTVNRTTTQQPYRPQARDINPNQTVSSAAQKQIREQEALKPSYNPTTPTISAPTAPLKQSYPTAIPIPGKTGWVYNPYNNNPVMVQGIAAGKTVRDPKDPNTDHKFKVP